MITRDGQADAQISRMSRIPRALQPAMRWLSHPHALFLIVVLAVWLPHGFMIGDVNDGWIQLNIVMTHDVAFRGLLTRTFGGLPMWTGFHLDPGGFIGIQALMLVFAFARAALFYELMKRLVPELPGFAVAAGLLSAFHAADTSYFWLGASGLNFGLVTALAACLCSVIYLQSGRYIALIATLVFQIVSGLTYSGFIVIMAALPVGAWLLAWTENRRPSAWYLVKMLSMIVAVMAVNAWIFKSGVGRDSVVADVDLHRALLGYVRAGERLITTWPTLIASLTLWHFVIISLVVVFAALSLRRYAATQPAGVQPLSSAKIMLFIGGCLGLALLAYFPYSLSTVRFQPNRTLLCTGLFAYTGILFLLFLVCKGQTLRWVGIATVCIVTGASTAAGLVGRDQWVYYYRAEERLLAALAKAVPTPAPGSYFLIHLQNPVDSRRIRGFTDREIAFVIALRYMYDQPKLYGGFYGFDDNMVHFDAKGVHARQNSMMKRENESADYANIVAFDYFPEQNMVKLLDRGEFAKLSGLTPAQASHYVPPAATGVPPEQTGRICSMLERRFRPDYCTR